MNKIRQIQELNKKELEQGISPQASWHTDYRDTAFVYFGGLPFELSEGDVITIFSQYGEPVFLKLARDRETGKSKGFGWLKYEDQRSTDLAVDNLGGASISGSLIHVDHARYKARDDEDLDEYKVGWEDIRRREGIVDATAGGNSETDGEGKYETESDTEKRRQHHGRRVGKEERPMLPEERELEQLIQDHDDEDPMKEYLIDEKKKEIEAALRRIEDGHGDEGKDRHHRHRSHKSHRSHRSHRSHKDGDIMDVDSDDKEHSTRKPTRHEGEADDRRERHHRREERDGRERSHRDRDRDRERHRGSDRDTGRERRRDDRDETAARDGRREHRDRHNRQREWDDDGKGR